jgi:hypothetical protein
MPSSGRWDKGGIVVWFDPSLSEAEQTNIISSYGLSGSSHADYWTVYITQSNVFEWCGIFDCNPQVEDVDLLWAELSKKK